MGSEKPGASRDENAFLCHSSPLYDRLPYDGLLLGLGLNQIQEATIAASATADKKLAASLS